MLSRSRSRQRIGLLFGGKANVVVLGGYYLLQLQLLLLLLVLLLSTERNGCCWSLRVVSTNKNGGHAQTFALLVDEDNNNREDRRRGNNLAVASSATTTTTTASISSSSSSSWFLQQQRASAVRNALGRLQAGVRSTFLPAGYPAATRPGFVRYAAWSAVQDLSTRLRDVLATQRILEGVGVGREGATALSALLNFLVRDGCGMAASLLFTAGFAGRFRSDVKRWRLLADVAVDVGITLEAISAHVPPALFLPMICLGNACKAVCGVAAGACSGPIHLHWASSSKSGSNRGGGSDISDVSAKFGAQQTVTGSVGLVFAALFARSVAHVGALRLWTLYVALTVLHICANVRCMRLLEFETLNTASLPLVALPFLARGSSHDDQIQRNNNQNSNDASSSSSLPGPAQVAQQEPLFFVWPRLKQWFSRKQTLACEKIQFGVSFNDFVKGTGMDASEVQDMLLATHNSTTQTKYWVAMGKGDDKNKVWVALPSGISSKETAQAYFHALWLLRRHSTATVATSAPAQQGGDNVVVTTTPEANNIQALWETFCQECRDVGWDLSRTEIRTRGYEIEIEQ